MRSITTWSDILALNCWVGLRSKLGWFVSVLIAASIAGSIVAQILEPGGQSAKKAIVVFFAVFVTVMALIWLVSFLLMLVVATAHLLRKGSIGPKKFTIANDAFTEDDGKQATVVRWREVRSIDKTRRHLFVRISRRKYIILSARDFEHEHHFAQYYADLVRMKHEST
jgi:hypothetical protein